MTLERARHVRAGINMSNIPSIPYVLLWEERQLMSVANLTRQDGIEFLRLVPQIGIVTQTNRYSLSQANQALADIRRGRFEGQFSCPEFTSGGCRKPWRAAANGDSFDAPAAPEFCAASHLRVLRRTVCREPYLERRAGR